MVALRAHTHVVNSLIRIFTDDSLLTVAIRILDTTEADTARPAIVNFKSIATLPTRVKIIASDALPTTLGALLVPPAPELVVIAFCSCFFMAHAVGGLHVAVRALTETTILNHDRVHALVAVEPR